MASKKEAKLSYKTMTIEDIINYCKAHGEVDWLKTTVETPVAHTVYPRKKVVKRDEMGNIEYNKKGKAKMVSVANTDEKPIQVMEKPTFFEIRDAFVEKFMPDIKPVAKKTKKPTMYELIETL